MVGVGRIQAGG